MLEKKGERKIKIRERKRERKKRSNKRPYLAGITNMMKKIIGVVPIVQIL
jgi:hypothetical protein